MLFNKFEKTEELHRKIRCNNHRKYFKKLRKNNSLINAYNFRQFVAYQTESLYNTTSNLLTYCVKLAKQQKYRDVSIKLSDFCSTIEINVQILSFVMNKIIINDGSVIQNFQQIIPANKQYMYDIISNILNLFMKLSLQKFQLKSMLILLRFCNKALNVCQKHLQNMYNIQIILLKYCRIAHKILQNPQYSHKVIHYLRTIQFPVLLAQFIQTCTQNKTTQIYNLIIQIIYKFVSSKTQTHNIINEIKIRQNQIDNQIYQSYFSFCIYFLINNEIIDHYSNLNSIKCLVKLQPRLMQRLEMMHIQRIFKYVLQKQNKNLQICSLQILENIVICCDNLVSSGILFDYGLLDIMQYRLEQEEHSQYSKQRQNIIQICKQILINIVSVSNHILQTIQTHPIWNYLSNCIDQKNPLLICTTVFAQIIINLVPKKSEILMKKYIESVSSLDLKQNIQNNAIKIIKKSLRQIYEVGLNQWPQRYYNNLRDYLCMHNMMEIINQQQL